MKRRISLGIVALLFSFVSIGQAQGTPTFFTHIYVSGNGARVVFEHSPFDEISAPIEIYEATTHRKTGQISRGRYLMPDLGEDGKPRFEFEELSVEALSSDGRYLLLRRLPLSKFTQDQIPQSYDPRNEPFLEAWDIVGVPRLKWRKRGVHFSDVKWAQGQIVVLFQKEVQRWNERGEILSRVPLTIGSVAVTSCDVLSSDGTRAVIGTDPPSVIETRTGRVLQKLDLSWPEQPAEFVFLPSNRYIWGHSVTPDEGFAPWDNYCSWNATDGKINRNSPQYPVFSPDGFAVWNASRLRFDSIATGKTVSLRAPALFDNKNIFLQTISGDGRVWAGFNPKGKPFWVTRNKVSTRASKPNSKKSKT